MSKKFTYIKNYSKEHKVELTKALLEEVENDLIGDEAPTIKIFHISESIDRARAIVKQRRDDPYHMDGFGCGFRRVDNVLKGFVPGELTIFTGVSGHGKTTFLSAMLINIALENIPVLFVTLEMLREEVDIWMDSQIKTKEAGENILEQLPIYYYDQEVVNIDVLETIVKEAVKQGIKFIAVDNIGFFTGRDTAEESITSIRLKLMAKKYRVPIMAVAHLRKLNSVNKLPTMDDCKGSGSIYQDADQFLVLWQDVTGAKIAKGNSLMLVRKNRRYGNKDTVEFQLDKNKFPIEVTKYFEEMY